MVPMKFEQKSLRLDNVRSCHAVPLLILQMPLLIPMSVLMQSERKEKNLKVMRLQLLPRQMIMLSMGLILMPKPHLLRGRVHVVTKIQSLKQQQGHHFHLLTTNHQRHLILPMTHQHRHNISMLTFQILLY